MKKNLFCLFIGIIILIGSSTFAVTAVDSFQISAIVKPITIISGDLSTGKADVLFFQNRIFVPLRLMAELMNSTVEWDGDHHTIYLENQKEFIDFPEADPWSGERFLYGQIINLDRKNNIITIEEHIDDNSIYTEPDIATSRDMVIVLQRGTHKMNIDFKDLRVGENIGIVLNTEGIARGIIISD